MIKYDKEEFKRAVKKLSLLHDLPEDVIADWLKDTYTRIEKQYRSKLSERMKGKTKSKLEALLKEDVWVCDYCDTVNTLVRCVNCGSFKNGEQIDK